MRSRRAAALSLCMAAAACADVFLPADPDGGPEQVARAVWEEVDAYYPHFALKGVDWDSVGRVHLPEVTSATTDTELIAVLADMLEALRDGHLALETPYGRRAYDGWYAPYPTYLDENLIVARLGGAIGSGAGGAVFWGTMGTRVGYLRIRTFSRAGIGEAVDQAIGALGNVEGLILDVRNNSGGSDLESEAAAGRFTDQERVYRTVRYKSGPGHEDFGPVIESTFGPAGPVRFDRPVVVLQNRRVFSAGEDFLLAMRVLPQVTFVGDTTGGGSANAFARTLPNGWNLMVPRWRLWAADGTVFEGIGLAPDETVRSPRLAFGEDRMLDRAVEILTLRTRSPSSP